MIQTAIHRAAVIIDLPLPESLGYVPRGAESSAGVGGRPFLQGAGGQGKMRVVSDLDSGLWHIPVSIAALIPDTQ